MAPPLHGTVVTGHFLGQRPLHLVGDHDGLARQAVALHPIAPRRQGIGPGEQCRLLEGLGDLQVDPQGLVTAPRDGGEFGHALGTPPLDFLGQDVEAPFFGQFIDVLQNDLDLPPAIFRQFLPGVEHWLHVPFLQILPGHFSQFRPPPEEFLQQVVGQEPEHFLRIELLCHVGFSYEICPYTVNGKR
jgi:hypothetical protein